MFVKLMGAALIGIEARAVSIEVNIGMGSKYYMVGLPDSAVRESWQRVETAIRNIGYRMPRQRIVVNLSPADLRKEGTAYDLSMAVGILAASGQLPPESLCGVGIMGELSLDGALLPVKGALSIASCAKQSGVSSLILPLENAPEAALVKGIHIYGMKNLDQVVRHLTNEHKVSAFEAEKTVDLPMDDVRFIPKDDLDMRDVRGQTYARRALEIAAAGGHNILLIGPPGSGKTMMARRISGILPPLRFEEALDTTKIHSVAGLLPGGRGLIERRPFRMPHHTISHVAMVGGGNTPQPGEISLAHNGILYMDELPEFARGVLEVLRQPMESGFMPISRARYNVEYPARFMLVASMNPCPCGYAGHPDRECTCPPAAVQRYKNRVSGPLLDRIDMHIGVQAVKLHELQTRPNGESSGEIRKRVLAAREMQSNRYSKQTGIYSNAQLQSAGIRRYCELPSAASALLNNAMEKLGLSVRAYDRILKMARTIADLDGSAGIHTEHLAEAIQYRCLDR